MNLGSDLKGHGIQRRLLCVVCAAALVFLAGCGGQLVNLYPVASLDEIPEVQYPWVVLNFDPNVKISSGTNAIEDNSVYLYHIPTRETQAICNDEVYVSDCDLQKKIAIGKTETDVVEMDLETTEYQQLGPARYEGRELVATSIRWDPDGTGYSAVTEDGLLVLWQYETGEFRPLTQIENREKYFDYVWIHDGQDICVPDMQGIALLNVETGERTHWLTLDITCPAYGSPAWPFDRKSFDVSADGRVVVYCCGVEIRALWLDNAGTIEREETLGKSGFENLGFAIAPDGDKIIFAVEDEKSELFSPNFYRLWLYDCEKSIILAEADYNSKGIELYW